MLVLPPSQGEFRFFTIRDPEKEYSPWKGVDRLALQVEERDAPKIKELEAELKAVRVERKEVKEGFEKERETHAQRINELETELSKLRMERQALQERFERLQSEHDRQKGVHLEKVKQLETRLSTVTGERQVMEERFAKERQAYTRRIKKLETELSSMGMVRDRERLERLKSDHEMAMSSESVNQLEDEISNLSAEKETLKERFEKARVSIQELECRLEIQGGTDSTEDDGAPGMPSSLRADIQYLAPEFCRTGVFTQQTDVYAFGITILEILTGKFKNALGIMEDAAEDAATFASILDPNAGAWDMDLAMEAAQVGLRCASLNKRSRPSMLTGEGAILPALESIASKVELADSMEPL
ncbi:hypothetical protein CBR_g42099 [Chara braunii]|uniref:Serine-threonine/tyrosine-protein kinase catalytic domain-containing protein n=1 Tax=Chara braunii TaxID=69332 RepID=A0A388LWX6_CHABU|nr:hypothetical protein CBR_g42099 [Chara braunii]|eukprot:GBG86816.1 hypothetical protein CBR_g42099 [Chara braunii]